MSRERSLSERNLTELLRIGYDTFIGRLHEGLDEAGYSDIRPAHGIVFQFMGVEGARVTDIAERAHLTKQTIGYLVDYLEERGYVERVPDPRDGRARIVRTTERGFALVQVAYAALMGLETHCRAALGSEDFARFRSLLESLIEALASADSKRLVHPPSEGSPKTSGPA